MSERKPDTDNTTYEKRPIGRFLLAYEVEPSESDIYSYARGFETSYEDILHGPGKSSKVASESYGDKIINLEFTGREDSYTWLLSTSGDKFTTEHMQRGGGMPLGGEVYELVCSPEGVAMTYYELNAQRSILRKREASDPAQVTMIQRAIEDLTNSREFHKRTSDIRGDRARAYASLARFDAKEYLSWTENKHYVTLKSQIVESGFEPGGRWDGSVTPLIH